MTNPNQYFYDHINDPIHKDEEDSNPWGDDIAGNIQNTEYLQR